MSSFIDKLPIRSMSFREIELYALFFLADYQKSALQELCPVDVIQILEHDIYDNCGVKVDLVDNLPLGIEAQTIFQTKKIQITELCYEKVHSNSPRDRFTIAHEIGHCILHLPKISNIQLLAARGGSSVIKPYQNPERQADYFAGALLMPLPAFCSVYEQFAARECKCCGISEYMANTFQVSVQAAQIRIKHISTNRGVYKLIDQLKIKRPFEFINTQKVS